MARCKKKEKKSKNKSIFEKSSGNVFFDIGFPEDEAINLQARTDMMTQIEKIIKDHNWTQVEAARFLGVRQPRISDLFRGRIEKFTVDMLMKWLCKLGKDVTLSVTDKTAA